ncbi:MAG: RNA ligase family protein, partial [Hyphomicrobiales bacterium]|nr:RNA ligase family protein [Hyphomicrobiales bacterium]
MQQIRKYPRTHHLQGSRLQPGDEDLAAEPVSVLHGHHVVVEEKLDGANCAISFDERGGLLLQSRGHYLTGGPRERHFELLKNWASGLANQLLPVLTDRFIVYGEWMYAKHTIYYDRLPHYFMEFGVFDCQRDCFLSTRARRKLLCGLPLCPVPVIHEGALKKVDQLHELIGPSTYKSGSWRDALAHEATKPP